MPRKNNGAVERKTRKNGTKVWVARFRYTDETGKQREKNHVVENKTDGYEWIDEQKGELKTTGKKAFSSKKTFQEFADWFDENHLVEAVREKNGAIIGGRKSIVPAKSQLKALREFFDDFMLKDIQYADLETYRAKRLKEPIKNTAGNVMMTLDKKTGDKIPRKRTASTVKKEFTLLQTILKKAMQQKLIAHNPFADGEPMFKKNVETERTRVLTRNEQDRLLAACDVVRGGRDRKHLKPLILFAVNTGMRRGEILRYTWNYIDFDNGVMYLPFEMTKTESERYVPILDELLPILEEMKARANSDDDRVFGNVGDYRVTSIGDFKRAWKTAKKIAGIEGLTFHDLRASFATRMMFERKIPSDIIMKVTGHKTDVFRRYIRPETESLVNHFRS